ncbi:MAG TPA: DNA polymerase III subunit epsilon [Caulobacteraceae bacterium]|jgi:DNA polymerase-3 subunit epsilon
MPREIVLDTETTGLDPYNGHRLIEVACVELDDLIPTGRTFHRYIHPERDIEVEAERVHGISLAFLAGKPKFADAEVVDAMLDFIGDATMIAHNAAFDRNFINAELERLGRAGFHEKRWLDTLGMAQQRFPGMYNSLDALCKRFKISLSERDKHGALVDAKLLANVYLELKGGRERRLDLSIVGRRRTGELEVAAVVAYGPRPRPLAALSSPEEHERHASFIRDALKDAAVWLQFEDWAPA